VVSFKFLRIFGIIFGMGERIFWKVNQAYGFDNYLRFRYGEAGEKKLMPCERIEDKSLVVEVLDNSVLKPKRLMLFQKDRQPVLVTIPETGETIVFDMPGKSAKIILTPELCDRRTVKNMVVETFGSKARRTLHVACVKDLEDAGWIAYYLPLQLSRLMDRARLVSKRTFKQVDGSRSIGFQEDFNDW